MAQTSISKSALSLVACFSFAALALTSHTTTARAQAYADGKWRIAIASGVRLRSAPNTSAEEVTRLLIGSVVRELEQSASKEKIGSSEDYWYRVSTGDGKEGWLFGSFTVPFDSNNPAVAYRRIASERLKVEQLSFADVTDLVRFLTSVTADVKDPAASAELEFARLMALKRALNELPPDHTEQSPHGAWIKANEASLVFSEPAGMWFVKSDLFWDLRKKHSGLPIAEQIAWEAANNPIPGECEGYVPCHLTALGWTMGEYLKLYPRGAHAEEAMDKFIEYLEPLIDLAKDGNVAPEDKPQARKDIAALRDVVTKTSSAKKTTALNLLNKLSPYYR